VKAEVQTVQNRTMPNILIAWELGGGLHHVMRTRALADAFTARGFDVYVALRDLSLRNTGTWASGTRVLQSPHALRVRLVDQPSTFADILSMNGWNGASELSGLVAGWSSLMELIDPAVVLVDHAPTAALVARLSEIPLVRMGVGFFAPPHADPLPTFRILDAASDERIRTVEDAVLRSVNAVASSCDRHFGCLADALAPDLDLLTCWPELDHYLGMRVHDRVQYIGPEKIRIVASPVQWPARPLQRVVAYLQADYPALQSVLQALSQADVVTVLYIGGRDIRFGESYASDKMSLRADLFDVGEALSQCDAVVCHAANGMTGSALAAGKPVLMLPMTAEQQLFARQVERLGAGISLTDNNVSLALPTSLRALLESSAYVEQARAVAARHADQADGLTTGVQIIADWMATPPTA
jgi:UDP:flavonoid glycosyltransferase YjiC (YdhE family)